MLTIYGKKTKYCDGVSRRSFLKVGGFAMGAVGGVTLPEILRAESVSGNNAPHKAVINVFLGGGPPHQDMWEIKNDAPSEIRGEFQPISTAVPDVQICEKFPKIAAMMDKFGQIGDQRAVEILQVIYREEIGHVAIGNRWYLYCCEQRGLDPQLTFQQLIREYFAGKLRGPFNRPARLEAGFNEDELTALENSL